MKPYIASLLVVLPLAFVPPPRERYVLTAGYTVTIDGTSNLRDWKENVGQVTGVIEGSSNTDGTIELTSIHMGMAVMSIKSDMGKVMDDKTYKALKAIDHPEIVFTLCGPARLSAARGAAVPVKGNLTLAGVCRPVTMQVQTFILCQGILQFEGYENITMTDFGVKPPTALFGTLRASPDITIHFKTNFINHN